jgi:ABC-2 type transport system permease protein
MRYLKLWLTFFRASWMADLEYRINIILRVIGEIIWYAAQLSVFEVLYLHTPAINGWDVHSMRVFMGSLFLVDVIHMILFSENIDAMWSMVRKGDLDLYLVKPINSQFMVSFRKIGTTYLINMMMVLGYVGWGISQLSRPITWVDLGLYAFLLLCGTAIYYSLRFLFCCLLVLLQDASNLHFLWYQLFRLAQRPDAIYPTPLRWIVLTVFPIGFLASVPSRVLIEGLPLELLLAAPLIALFLLFFSNWCWEKSLLRYSSASS